MTANVLRRDGLLAATPPTVACASEGPLAGPKATEHVLTTRGYIEEHSMCRKRGQAVAAWAMCRDVHPLCAPHLTAGALSRSSGMAVRHARRR